MATESWASEALDPALEGIKNESTILTLCSAKPTNYTQAYTTYALCDTAVTASMFTITDGTTSGRKMTLEAQTDVLVDTSGTAEYFALVDTVNSILKYVGRCLSQAVTLGEYINISSVVVELRDAI